MRKIVHIMSVLITTLILAGNAWAITWFPQDFECPIDNETNTFLVVGSYGSYIYSYPSKYQWLFFPQTDSPTYYICKKCHLTTYMWDFDKLPKEKIAAIKNALKDVKVSKAFKEYTELSVSERLNIMEKVYAVLDKKEDWWETFYRVKGYHLAKEGKSQEAQTARQKSLDYIQKGLMDEKNETPKKLLFYISGAMKHFMTDDTGAIADLEKALNTKYYEKDAQEEDIKNAEEGLNDRIKEYIGKIKSDKEKPRLFDKSGGEDHDDH